MARAAVTKSGRRLSEADIERLADEAEQGYDVSRWIQQRGRPALEPGTDSPSPRIAVRLPLSLHRKVAARATAEGKSVSEVVRSLLEDYADAS
jgi:predicted HicB family RNase H-like nuclease